MKKYNVLWIDDKPSEQEGFIDDAFLEDIIITPFTTSKAGMKELMDNTNHYDAIVLDALGYDESEDESEELTGLMKSIKTINSLDKKIPYFIYSAYMDKDEFKHAKSMLGDEEIFTKGTGNQKLFLAIKKSADNQPETQIRHEFPTLFNALETYSSDHKGTFLHLIQEVKKGGASLDDKLYFTQIRIVLEEMFRKANELGLLHDKCISNNGKVNLAESSLFLSGEVTKHLNVKCSKVHFSKIIADNVKNIIFVTGAASHTTDPQYEKNINIQKYRDEIKTPYLLFSLIFSLMDVVIWFDEYSKENSNYMENVNLWEDLTPIVSSDNWVEGTITRLADNGWANFKPKNSDATIGIPPKMVESNNLKENDSIKIKTKPSPDGTKTYVTEINKNS